MNVIKRWCGGMVDASDSKSGGKPWGFKSLHQHHLLEFVALTCRKENNRFVGSKMGK